MVAAWRIASTSGATAGFQQFNASRAEAGQELGTVPTRVPLVYSAAGVFSFSDHSR